MSSNSDAAVCKGSWILGSACGHCERCRNEAIRLMPTLLADRRRLESVAALVLPMPIGGGDLSEGFRLKCYDEIRGVLAVKKS